MLLDILALVLPVRVQTGAASAGRVAAWRRQRAAASAYVLGRPVVKSIVPAVVSTFDRGFTLIVNGRQFGPSSIVLLDEMERPTTFLSPTQLAAEIFSRDIGAPPCCTSRTAAINSWGVQRFNR